MTDLYGLDELARTLGIETTGSPRAWMNWIAACPDRGAITIAPRAPKPADLIREITEAVEGLRVHPIHGYEWECAECHYHFAHGACHVTGLTATRDEYVDSDERPVDHATLLDRAAVLRILAEKGKAP